MLKLIFLCVYFFTAIILWEQIFSQIFSKVKNLCRSNSVFGLTLKSICILLKLIGCFYSFKKFLRAKMGLTANLFIDLQSLTNRPVNK
jgi:hypothetical protein